MAVTECKVRWGATPGNFDGQRQRTYELEYLIHTDSKMSPIGVMLGAQLLEAPNDPLPVIYQTYSLLGDEDLDATCQNVHVERVDDNQWLGKVTFSSRFDEAEINPDPLLRPVRYRGTRMVTTRPATVDKDGSAVTDSAGQEFDESLEQEVSYVVLTAVRNVATLDEWIADFVTYINAVNSDTYRGQSARKWWVMDIECSDIIKEEGSTYYQETWNIAFNFNTWDEVVLDRGWFVLDDSEPPEAVRAKDGKGEDVNAPVLLDGTGHKLEAGGDPVPLVFRIKREVSFGSIPV